jgi:plasmid stabilization system protein ParE
MTRRVEFRRAAERDLDRIADFLVQFDRRVSDRRIDWLQTELRKLAVHPFIGRPASSVDRRELTLRFGKSSYLVRYRVTDDLVEITRIWHGRENRG